MSALFDMVDRAIVKPILSQADRMPFEPMIVRKLRENAEDIRNMGWDAIAEAHRAGVAAHYVAPELGEGIVRETPDGVRHLERKIDGAWSEVAVFPPRAGWRAP